MKQLDFEAIVQNIDSVTEFIDTELELHGCNERALLQINVAIDEIFGNIAQYAYLEEKGNVTVKINIENGFAEITFIDEGISFNPLSLEDLDVSLGADQRSIGGLGIFLVKKTMDKLEYERRDNKNILKLTKRI